MVDNTLSDLLLSCLHWQAIGIDREDFHRLDESDWESLLLLAAKQRVTALLFHRLRKQDLLESVPLAFRERLETGYRSNAFGNLRKYAELKRIAAAFQAEDIPLITLKGMHLAKSVYGDIGLREMNDMDLLVPAKDLLQVLKVMNGLGYVSRAPFGRNRKPFAVDVDAVVAHRHHLPPLFKSGEAAVEIHWAITEPNKPYAIDPDELWSRAVPLPAAGGNVLALSPEDLLLHLCTHASYHHGFALGLRAFCDIAQMIEHFGEELDWELVSRRTFDWGWDKGVYLTLSLARELVGAAVPANVLDRLCPDNFNGSLASVAATAREQVFADKETAFAVDSPVLDRWADKRLRHKITDVLKRVFLPPASLSRYYGLPADSLKVYLYYPVRLKDLVVGHGSTLWGIYNGDPKFAGAVRRREKLIEFLKDDARLPA